MSNDVPVRSDRINSTNQCDTALDALDAFFYFDKHGGYLFETFYLNNSEGVTKSFEPLHFIGSF